MKINRDIYLLRQILEHCQELATARQTFGDGVEALEAERIYHYSAAFSVLRIGLLSSRLSEGLRSAHDEIPWEKLAKMGEIPDLHGEGYSVRPLWDVMEREAPKLKAFCQDRLMILEALEAREADKTGEARATGEAAKPEPAAPRA